LRRHFRHLLGLKTFDLHGTMFASQPLRRFDISSQ